MMVRGSLFLLHTQEFFFKERINNKLSFLARLVFAQTSIF
jgi:hypothetical protein